MKDAHTFYGKVSRPKNKSPILEIHAANDWQKLAQTIHDHFGNNRLIIRVEIDDLGPKDNERRYFHAVVKKYCQRGFYDVGYKYSEEKTYDELKRAYKETPANEATPSFANLQEADYKSFIDWCIQFAAENLNIAIPLPTSQTIQHFPIEQR